MLCFPSWLMHDSLTCSHRPFRSPSSLHQRKVSKIVLDSLQCGWYGTNSRERAQEHGCHAHDGSAGRCKLRASGFVLLCHRHSGITSLALAPAPGTSSTPAGPAGSCHPHEATAKRINHARCLPSHHIYELFLSARLNQARQRPASPTSCHSQLYCTYCTCQV